MNLNKLWKVLDGSYFDKEYTAEQVEDLMRRVKVFNAGVIDEHLNKHVDKVFKEWITENK